MIGQTLAQYEIIDLLGRGGMGEVYRARDTTLGREVALKLLPPSLTQDPERAARFEREARTLASLQDAHVASIYGFEQAGEQRFLVMELVEGEDLAERIRRGPLPLEEALRVARQVALGLEAAHQKGIVHRDLKPANIKLSPEGEVKILDFGLARAIAAEPDAQDLETSPTITAAMTQAGTVLGTAAYMSPEQARGKAVDARTDIWAFGCVLYEMLVGEQAYPGETVSDVIAKILEREPDLDRLPATTPANVSRLLRRCVSKDPHTRLHHIADARLELDELESPAPEATGTDRRSHGALLWIPWLLVLGLATALAWTLVRPQTAPVRVTRFSIDPPPGTSMREFALAPDGTALAFVVTDKGGTSQLWVRRFDRSEPEPMPHSTGAMLPFWSPDGTALGYFQDGKLRRLDLATRTTLTLADAPNGRGAAWSEDGKILFTPEGLDVLYTVAAEGGPVTPVTRLHVDDTFPDEATHRFPHFIPGTDGFIYVAQDPEATVGTARSYLASLQSPDDRKPIVMGLTEVYATKKHLLFVREQTLIAQPFDRSRKELIGAATALASDLSNSYPRTGATSFSVSQTGVLAYRSIVAPETQLVWYDRSGQKLEPLIASAEGYIGPSLSPDGRRLAYLRVIGDNGELWVDDLVRGTKSRLDTTEGESGLRMNSPRWVSDDTVVYVLAGALYRRRVDRNDPRQLVWSEAEDGGSDLPTVVMHGDYGDGTLMVLQNWDSDTDWDLWTLRPDQGASPQILVRNVKSQTNPSLSPDGEWVAYESDESGRFEVYVQNIADAGQRRVVSNDGGGRPLWSPDGDEIYYISPDFELMAVPVQVEGDLLPGNPRRLFEAPLGVMDFFFNVDPAPQLLAVQGDRFLFNAAIDPRASQQVDIVLNWEAELPRD